MKRLFIRYNAMALICLALFFLITPVFAQGQAIDYLTELGKSYYSLGKVDDALHEFNKALLLDPANQTAKDYVNKIFSANSLIEPVPTITEKPVKKVLIAQAPKPELSREGAMNFALNDLEGSKDIKPAGYIDVNNPVDENDTGEGLQYGPLRISGDMQASFGITPKEFIWKRANFDMNEKSMSWRVNSADGFNNRFDTFDPRIYDSLGVNLDTDNKDGFNFHTNVTVDPWSFTGKSNKVTVINGTDVADVQLRYWSNTGHVINNTVYSTNKAATINIPEMKVINEKTSAYTTGGFTIPAMKIERQFQPLRELWLDYTNDQIKFRAFPLGYQDQAYTSDDPLGITNHRIWWQDSLWLRKYTPGVYHNDPTRLDFTKGFWDDSFSFLTKDSSGKYLTALRGFSFSFAPGESTSFDTTFATPKDLWQDYGEVDNVINASRLKHYLADNFMVGATFSSRLGFKVDNESLDSQNYVGGIDLGYEITNGLKAQAEVLTSKSYYDQSNSNYKTESRGNAYYFSLIGRYPQQSIMDLKYGYDEIALDKKNGESFLLKSKFYAARMDGGFDSALSNFHNTRQDVFWGRHIHFRKPFEYYNAGFNESGPNWDELNASRIGDGIDVGRNVWGFRIETILEDKFSNLFDLRNVHNVNGKFIENVVRDEVTAKVTDKLTFKALGIYQKLPRTLGGFDPFIYDGNTGDFFINALINDGEDPTIKTGSFGLNYDFFDWLSLNGVYERTNDYNLAYDNFPSNTLRDNTTLGGTYYQNGMLYRYKNPWLYSQANFPKPPYDFYNIFKTGLRVQPMDKMDIYLDYTRNEFASAGQNSDNMNHVGIEMTYMPCEKFGMALKYTYSRWQDVDRLAAGETNSLGHHNFFSEFRYLPSKDDEVTLQYGEGNTSTIGNMSLDPYGGTLLAIDTAHMIRAYYRRKF